MYEIKVYNEKKELVESYQEEEDPGLFSGGSKYPNNHSNPAVLNYTFHIFKEGKLLRTVRKEEGGTSVFLFCGRRSK